MRIYLSGPMGAGKSTVGEALAARTGRPFSDLDQMVAEEAKKSIAELFSHEGEKGFRRRECAAASRLTEEGAADLVVALGGGTVTDPRTRRLLVEDGLVVTLTAGVDTLTQRVAHKTGRPLLAERDAREVLGELLEERKEAYAECHATLDAAQPIESLVDAILEVEKSAPIAVCLGTRSYRVEVGAGVRERVGACARALAPSSVVLVTDSVVHEPWGAGAVAALRAVGLSVAPVILEPGEAAKNLASVEAIWDAALSASIDRSALVIGVGGGVVGDLAGFAAATLLRGVRFAQLPTTLLSMVDASVGGKTGFDRPQGKNLVGAFHQPSFVLCDVETLATLPEADRVAGLAEVAKSAWLAGPAAVAELESDAAKLARGEAAATERAIRMSVRLKARIVGEDEREGGRRRLLNLGHTVGHAYEAAAGFGGMRHGDAVARGMVAAFRIARALGVGDVGQEARMVALLTSLGLPTDVAGRGTEEVLALLGSDKKRQGGDVRFIAPGAPGEATITPVALERLRALVASL